MTRFLIFTPTHPATTTHLLDCARSVARAASACKSEVFWEVHANTKDGQAEVHATWARECLEQAFGSSKGEATERVQWRVANVSTAGIGALKFRAAMWGMDGWDVKRDLDGVWLVELDADDLLHCDALRLIEDYLALLASNGHPRPAMLYAGSWQFRSDGGEITPYRADHGWKHTRQGLHLLNHQFPISPCSLSSILFSPDHLRVYNAQAYLDAGGHDPRLQACDDHDLTQRIALRHGLRSILKVPGALYFYRHHHEQRTKVQGVDDIQETSRRLWRERAEPIAMAWAKELGVLAIELGNPELRPGYDLAFDRRAKTAAWRIDLEAGTLPLMSNRAGWIRADHVLEHLSRPLKIMAECWRVLVHGGLLSIEVPSALGWGAFADPTHRSFWVEQSFAYYTDPDMARFLSGTRLGFAPIFQGNCEDGEVEEELWARFQLVSLEHATLVTASKIGDPRTPVIRAVLAADKGGERLPGLNHWRNGA